MFTGIIECTGAITDIYINGKNHSFWVQSPVSEQLHPDQSISHNGVCLTVEEVANGRHRVTAIAETLEKTNLGQWQAGTTVNLERCLAAGQRFDGHFVQGHVDAVAACTALTEQAGSWEFDFSFDPSFAPLLVEKGSVCLNGISLTVFNVGAGSFRVAIIPYTFTHTNMQHLRPGHSVNIEFDMIGKYIQRHLQLRTA